MNVLTNKPLLIAIVVIIILIMLLCVSGTNDTILRSAGEAGTLFSPLQEFFYRVSNSIGEFFDGVLTSSDAARLNKEMENELAALKTRANDYEEIRAQNERLKEMLDFKQQNTTMELKAANIIGKNPGNWFDVFMIDIGRRDGVVENMPVITPDGLVGRVEEVNLNSAKVMTIIDGRSSVSVLLERTRDVGAVQGSIGNDSLDVSLYMNHLPLDADIAEGDRVITSGLDGIFPKGLLIGEVDSSVDSEEDGKNVKIEPEVDFRRLEEVFVVIASDGEELGQSSAAEEVITGRTD